jgi:hypothetical protein
MKTRISIALIAIIGLFALTGCAVTKISDSTLKKRTVSLNILGVIQFEKTTEGLTIGNAELIEKEGE